MKFSERVVNGVISFLFQIITKVKIDGIENIPPEGPAIIISNHTSFIEGPLFYIKLRPRRTIALAKKELWDKAISRVCMNAWGSIPVDRDGMDMKAIRSCFGVLDDGNFLCIAPEGTRSEDGTLKKAMPGTTFFASRHGVPIYPLVQWGLKNLSGNMKRLRRTVVNINFGKPFLVEKPGGGRLTGEDRAQMADEMMYRLADLLPEELRGAYSDDSKRTEDFIRPLQG